MRMEGDVNSEGKVTAEGLEGQWCEKLASRKRPLSDREKGDAETQALANRNGIAPKRESVH